ncbi:MAG: cytochrome B [Ancylobacter novellus]|uniref:Cytochrome B n=1 Tax=Ancylobacter novellus TaxID=921 RepID=A0A2W5KGT0_ANCNO|nr:MAG: cytochrome B [Ancylobacter novellus]
MSDLPAPAAGGYRAPAKILHWAVAVLVLGMIPVGLVLESLPKGPIQDFFYAAHKSTGFLILVLMLARLAFRLVSPPPPPEPGLARWQVGLSHAVHWTLYAILIVMPIVGWAGSNAFGAPVSVYGLFTLPDIVAKDEEFSKTLFAIHETLGLIAAALIALHVAAALYHRFALKDAVLARMTTAPARR